MALSVENSARAGAAAVGPSLSTTALSAASTVLAADKTVAARPDAVQRAAERSDQKLHRVKFHHLKFQ